MKDITTIKVSKNTLQEFNQLCEEAELHGRNQDETVRRLLKNYKLMKEQLGKVWK